MDIDLPPLTASGLISAAYREVSLAEAASGTAAFGPVDFQFPTTTFQLWNLDYSGTLGPGGATVSFHYDPTQLGTLVAEESLAIYHFENGRWELQNGVVDTVNNTITVSGIHSFSPWGLGLAPAAVTTPEPASLALWTLGALGCAVSGYRRRSVA